MVITVANQKGGVAKTTTAQALGQVLAFNGYKVLFIDMDPQEDLSLALGADSSGLSIYDLMTGAASLEEVIQETPGWSIIPGSIELAAAEMDFTGPGMAKILRKALKPIRSLYDFIIIDTPPALGVLTMNALTAADYVLIPLQADIFSLRALRALRGTIQTAQELTNKDLKILGLLLTRYNDKTIISKDIKEVLENQAASFNARLFKTAIHKGVAIEEAQAERSSIIKKKDSRPAQDYMALTEEVLKILEDEKDEQRDS